MPGRPGMGGETEAAGSPGNGCAGGSGVDVQEASNPIMSRERPAARAEPKECRMALLLLEALLALLALIAIVWWTMFHGRTRGELPPAGADEQEAAASVKSERSPD